MRRAVLVVVAMIVGVVMLVIMVVLVGVIVTAANLAAGIEQVEEPEFREIKAEKVGQNL